MCEWQKMYPLFIVVSRDLGSVGSQTTELTSTTVLQFPLALLQGSESDCEAVVGLHTLIRDKFDAIMAKSFKPVPSNPDFFFYCLPTSCEKQVLCYRK